jgi:hypothetical protein
MDVRHGCQSARFIAMEMRNAPRVPTKMAHFGKNVPSLRIPVISAIDSSRIRPPIPV